MYRVPSLEPKTTLSSYIAGVDLTSPPVLYAHLNVPSLISRQVKLSLSDPIYKLLFLKSRDADDNTLFPKSYFQVRVPSAVFNP